MFASEHESQSIPDKSTDNRSASVTGRENYSSFVFPVYFGCTPLLAENSLTKKHSARTRKARASSDALQELYQHVQRGDLPSLFSSGETHLERWIQS